MKQSGFDGLLVAFGVALWGSRDGRSKPVNVAAVTAGAAVPLGVSAVHGLLVGWSNYWFAVVGYKLSASSGAGSSFVGRLDALGKSWIGAQRDLALPVGVAVVIGAVALARRQSLGIPLLWLGAAFIGFNSASLYWPHYYVQLLPPLVLLLAVGVVSLPGRVVALSVVTLVAGPALMKVVALDQLSRNAKEHVIPYYGQFVRDQRIAREVDLHSRPGEAVYALDSEADLYFLADRRAAFPYLWAHPLEEVPGALGRLRSLLDGDSRPGLVVVFRSPSLVDSTGALSRILATDYRPLETVPGTDVELLQRA
jgi:hypothetical protein